MGGTAGAFNRGLAPGGPLNNGDTGYGVRSGWRIVGAASHGSVNGAGAGITQIQFGQFPSIKPPSPSSIVRLYALLWTPSDYSGRAVTFAVSGHAPPTIASIYLDLDGQVGASAYVVPGNIALGSVTIPIAPAPSALALPLLGLLALRWRADSARQHAARLR